MATPKFVYLTADGVSTVFNVGEAYLPGSTALSVNILQQRDGWDETDPSAGIITIASAPLLADTVIVWYLDTTADPTEIVHIINVDSLSAEIVAEDAIDAVSDEVTTTFAESSDLYCMDSNTSDALAVTIDIEETGEIIGVLWEGC